MRYQTTPFNCGPAALQNALIALGIRVGQQRCSAMCGTTYENGTDEHGIVAAVQKLGLVCEVISYNSVSDAWLRLHLSLACGYPVILCVDRWTHWVTAIGVLGTRVVIFDPSRSAINKSESGVYALSQKSFLRRWYTAYRTRKTGPKYYGVAVHT